MIFHRFASLSLPLFAALAAITLALAVPALAAPEPVAVRIFYSSNLRGQILPCG